MTGNFVSALLLELEAAGELGIASEEAGATLLPSMEEELVAAQLAKARTNRGRTMVFLISNDPFSLVNMINHRATKGITFFARRVLVNWRH